MKTKAISVCLIFLSVLVFKAYGQNDDLKIHGTWVLKTTKHADVLPDTIRIMPSQSEVKIFNDMRSEKSGSSRSRVILRNNSLLFLYDTPNKWTDTCKILLKVDSKLKGSGFWRLPDGSFENAEQFKVKYSFLPEMCSNHPKHHIANSPEEREELTRTKHCSGFHSL